MKEKTLNAARIIVLSAVFASAIGYSLADWVPPPQPPPFGNTPPPINVGGATQVKDGNLFLKWLVAKKARGTDPIVGGSFCSPVSATCDSGDTLVTKNYVDGKVGDNLGNHTATQNLNMGNMLIRNLTNPALSQDAATKAYVDGKVSAIGPMKFFTGTGCGACPYGAVAYGPSETLCKVKNQNGALVNPNVAHTYRCHLLSIDTSFAFWSY